MNRYMYILLLISVNTFALESLDQLLQKGMIRTATVQDFDRWERQKQKELKVFMQELPSIIKWKKQADTLKAINIEPPSLKDVKEYISSRLPIESSGYIILKKITIPTSFYQKDSATFFLEKGVPYPDGKLGHSKLYDFNTMSCQGFGCRNTKSDKIKKLYSQCEFNEFELPDDIQIYASDAPKGKVTGHTIDDSNQGAFLVKVVVNSPNKPVALILSSYSPCIWDIKWTEGTKIEAVFTTGYYGQEVSGLAKDIPIGSSTLSNGEHPCYLLGVSHKIRDLVRINTFSNKVYGKNTTVLYTDNYKNDTLIIGNEISKSTKLYSSNDNSIESFFTTTEPNAGNAGMEYLLKNNMIRRATEHDLNSWAQERYKLYLKQLKTSSIKATAMNINMNSLKPICSYDNGYVILKKIRIPAELYGGNLAVFFLKKGVPYPDGDLAHSTLFDFNSLQCKGSSCGVCSDQSQVSNN
ncbi:hypothetical protein MN086_03385 [Sulfurovum sp. XGS-02]|uniref:hypothetical protein n=1 Tax=Sulfurovum sp. XGS-02 TaxID=2925411 RepID=UPI0020521744|nr:hypothetical protein [Sulfurovum sp. XGS-02]UPT78195.1 hypothetical protein MN086_03385 [Sulfurovum sp. XGS-02]